MTKLKFKLSSMLLILSTCAISYVNAADHDGGGVAIHRSPSRYHFNDDRSLLINNGDLTQEFLS